MRCTDRRSPLSVPSSTGGRSGVIDHRASFLRCGCCGIHSLEESLAGMPLEAYLLEAPRRLADKLIVGARDAQRPHRERLDVRSWPQPLRRDPLDRIVVTERDERVEHRRRLIQRIGTVGYVVKVERTDESFESAKVGARHHQPKPVWPIVRLVAFKHLSDRFGLQSVSLAVVAGVHARESAVEEGSGVPRAGSSRVRPHRTLDHRREPTDFLPATAKRLDKESALDPVYAVMRRQALDELLQPPAGASRLRQSREGEIEAYRRHQGKVTIIGIGELG